MKIPYTYALKCPDDRVYYGAKWGKDANPATFWSEYFTSSEEIEQMREQYGDDKFEYEIRRTFDNEDDCILWEKRVLTKLNAAYHPKMVNKHNGTFDFDINARRVHDGTHNFLGVGNSGLSKQRVEDGTHQFCDSEWQRQNALMTIEKGTHYFSSDEHKKASSALANERIANGTHHFLDSELQSKNALKRVAEGTHPFQSKVVCPDCGRESNASGIARHKCQGING